VDPENSTSNIIINSEHHPLFCLLIFLYFIAIFHLEKRTFPYLEVHTGPWKHHPTSSPTIPIFFLIFSPFLHLVQLYLLYMEMCNGPWKQHHTPFFSSIFYAILFIYKCMQFLLWKCALDPEMMRLLWGNEVAIEMKKWNVLWQEWKRLKEISFSCCRDLE